MRKQLNSKWRSNGADKRKWFTAFIAPIFFNSYTGSVEMFHKIRSFIHEAVEAVSFFIFTIYRDHSLKFYFLDLSCEDFLTANFLNIQNKLL